MANLMTYDELIAKYKGQKLDWDGVSPNQCVDWVKAYLELCYGIPTGKGKAVWGNAKDYYLNFNNIAPLKAKFDRIKYTNGFVPNKGDICVYGATKSNEYGHICIAYEKCTASTLCSYDQNYGQDKTIRLVKHKYDNLLGVLRPKDTKAVVNKTATTESKSVKKTVTATALNVRADASMQASVVKVIYKGATVTVTESKNGFSKIGANMWCASQYLK